MGNKGLMVIDCVGVQRECNCEVAWKGTLTTVSIITIHLVVTSSISILQFETEPTSNIKTAEDAIWWSYTTVTTVDYGDKFPALTEGRIIAAILMTAGVGLFGIFTAYVATFFIEGKS